MLTNSALAPSEDAALHIAAGRLLKRNAVQPFSDECVSVFEAYFPDKRFQIALDIHPTDSRSTSGHSTLICVGPACSPPAASIRSSAAISPIS